MDSFAMMQTCPYTVVVGECPHGHVHILGGFVSDVRPGKNEDPDDCMINDATGEVFRVVSNITLCLN